jgi:lipid II isoglutaminyl synthase (glutamine-hydrolysing)
LAKGAAVRGISSVAIVTVFPDLLGTYGDSGNALALKHRLEARGFPAVCMTVAAGDPIPLDGDVYLIGGGEDRAQKTALRSIGSSLGRAVERGAAVLGVCAGFQLLGTSVSDGVKAQPGLGLLDAVTHRMPTRAVGDIIVDPTLPIEPLVGFENHRGGTVLGPRARPLGTVVVGTGNDGSGLEGAMQGSVFGTYQHGPVLALNPGFADLLLSRVVGELPALEDPWVQAARSLRLARLHTRPTRRERRR